MCFLHAWRRKDIYNWYAQKSSLHGIITWNAEPRLLNVVPWSPTKMILTQRCSFICFRPFISWPITLSISLSALSSCRMKQNMYHAQGETSTDFKFQIYFSKVWIDSMISECKQCLQWVCIQGESLFALLLHLQHDYICLDGICLWLKLVRETGSDNLTIWFLHSPYLGAMGS